MKAARLAIASIFMALACGSAVRTGLCPGEVPPISVKHGSRAYGADSATLKVVPAYILRDPCPNWKSALEIAKRISGCWKNGLRGTCPRCPIPCNTCQFLEDGFFPVAKIVTHIDFSIDAISAVGVPKDSKDGVKEAAFMSWLCFKPRLTEILAKAMVHESIHLCKEVVPETPVMNDAWFRKWIGVNIGPPDTRDLVDECWKNNER